MAEQDESIQKIKDNILIFDLLPGVDSQTKMPISCPLNGHGDKTPSFSIYEDGRKAKCHSKCGDFDVFSLYQFQNNCSFPDAIKALEQMAGTSSPDNGRPSKPKKKTPQSKYKPSFLSLDQVNLIHQQLLKNESLLKDFQAKYGLSIETIKKYLLGFQNEKYIIPFQICPGQWLIKEHKGLQSKGSKASIYPSDIINKDLPYVLITEGEYKALLLNQNGFPAVSGTCGASTWKADWNHLFAGHNVVLAFDNDEAGKKGAEKVAANLKDVADCIKIFHWPSYMDSKDQKDVTDWFVKLNKSKADFQALIDQAKKYVPESKTIEIDGIVYNKTIQKDNVTYLLPNSYVVKGNSLYKIKKDENGKDVPSIMSSEIPYISHLFRDIDTGILKARLCYGASIKEIMELSEFTAKQRACKLINLGFPIYESNASVWINYFFYFLQENKKVLKPSLLCSCNGWKTIEGIKVFILGTRHFSVNTGKHLKVELKPESPGFLRYIEALNPAGSFKEWERVVLQVLNAYTIPSFSLIATFTSVVLELLNQSNFIIDIASVTSDGKTTTNRFAASPWGHPSSFIINEFTSVGVEQLVSFFNGLSIYIQDTHKKRNRRFIESAIYLLADGVGRLRGAKSGGIRKVPKFSAVSFTTGEETLADLVDYEGSIARTIGFTDYPFGAKTKELEIITSNINSTVDSNYGHAGIRWLEFITSQMKDPDFIPSIKKSHEKNKGYFVSGSAQPGALRTVSYFASVMVTAELLAKCFKWSFDLLSFRVMDAFKLATRHNEDTLPKHQKAFRAFQSWVEGNLNKFINGGSCPDRGDIYGIYLPGEYVAVLPSFLEKQFLADSEFPKSILKQWKEEGFLDCDPGHRTKLICSKIISAGYIKRTRYYCVPWKIFNPE